MKHLSSLALCAVCVVCAGASALAAPTALAAPAPAPAVGQLAKLAFAPGSAALALDVVGDLAGALTWAHAHPDGLVVLDGHADPGGPPAHGAQLSLRRAKAVRAHLVAAGANPEQLVIAAFGGDARRDGSVIVWGSLDPAPLRLGARAARR